MSPATNEANPIPKPEKPCAINNIQITCQRIFTFSYIILRGCEVIMSLISIPFTLRTLILSTIGSCISGQLVVINQFNSNNTNHSIIFSNKFNNFFICFKRKNSFLMEMLLNLLSYSYNEQYSNLDCQKPILLFSDLKNHHSKINYFF